MTCWHISSYRVQAVLLFAREGLKRPDGQIKNKKKHLFLYSKVWLPLISREQARGICEEASYRSTKWHKLITIRNQHCIVVFNSCWADVVAYKLKADLACAGFPGASRQRSETGATVSISTAGCSSTLTGSGPTTWPGAHNHGLACWRRSCWEIFHCVNTASIFIQGSEGGGSLVGKMCLYAGYTYLW